MSFTHLDPGPLRRFSIFMILIMCAFETHFRSLFCISRPPLVTKAYHLPSKVVLHVTGPQIPAGPDLNQANDLPMSWFYVQRSKDPIWHVWDILRFWFRLSISAHAGKDNSFADINDLQTSKGHDQVLQPNRRFSSLQSGTRTIEDRFGGKSENLSAILTG